MHSIYTVVIGTQPMQIVLTHLLRHMVVCAVDFAYQHTEQPIMAPFAATILNRTTWKLLIKHNETAHPMNLNYNRYQANAFTQILRHVSGIHHSQSKDD